jgi:hypothetical protein
LLFAKNLMRKKHDDYWKMERKRTKGVQSLMR